MSTLPPPTWTTYAVVIAKGIRSVGIALVHIAARPFSADARPKSVFKDFAYALFRSLVSGLTDEQEECIISPTDEAVKSWASNNKVVVKTAALKSGLKCYWIGEPKAEKTILFFHGGGFRWGCSPGHLTWLYRLQGTLRADGMDVACLVVGYSLTPGTQYPVQLTQAVEALQWLEESAEKSAKNIMLLGDSAGGNLVLGLLSHLLHPHPSIPQSHLAQEPLAGAVVISPMCSFDTTTSSFRKNLNSDVVPPAVVKKWSSLYLGASKLDNYNHPVSADVAWFRGLDEIVDSLLVWAGSKETLLDSIEELHGRLRKAHPRTELFVNPEAAHEEMIVEINMGYKVPTSDDAEVISRWISSKWA